MTTKRKKGPATTCTQSIANAVLDLLAQGKTPIQIEKLAGMPKAKTVYQWAQSDQLVTDDRAENTDELSALDRALIAFRNAREAHTAAKILSMPQCLAGDKQRSVGSTKSEHSAENSKKAQNRPESTNKAESNVLPQDTQENTQHAKADQQQGDNVIPLHKFTKSDLDRLEADCRFHGHYARAREIGLWIMADDLLRESDDDSKDYDQNGQPNHAAIQRSKLRVDARKWLLARRLRSEFGDRASDEAKPSAPDVVLTGYDVDL